MFSVQNVRPSYTPIEKQQAALEFDLFLSQYFPMTCLKKHPYDLNTYALKNKTCLTLQFACNITVSATDHPDQLPPPPKKKVFILVRTYVMERVCNFRYITA